MGYFSENAVASLANLVNRHAGQLQLDFVKGSLIYTARQKIVEDALSVNADYVFFIDSDIIYNAGALQKLIDDDRYIVSGLYVNKVDNHPIAYSKIVPQGLFKKGYKTEVTDFDTPLYPIEGAGLGFCLIHTDVFKVMKKRYGHLFMPYKNLGEDFSFFYRARKCGFEVNLDTTIKLGHETTAVHTLEDLKNES